MIQLKGNYPDWAIGEYQELLESYVKSGILFLELNDSDSSAEEPSDDLDLMVTPEYFQLAKQILMRLNFLFYRHLNTNQEMWIKLVSGHGFAQVHLYSGFYYFGKKLASFEEVTQISPTILFLAELFYKNNYSQRTDNKFRRLSEKWEYNPISDFADSILQRAAKHAWENIHHRKRKVPVSRVKHILNVFSLNGLAATREFAFRIKKRLHKIIKTDDDIIVFIMGADGTGKSTATQAILKRLHNSAPITKIIYMGLRFSVVNGIRSAIARTLYNAQKQFKNRQDGSSFPLKTKRRKGIIAILIGVLYWLEWVFRYWICIRLRVIPAPTLWLIDRCYLDILLHYDNPVLNHLMLEYAPRPTFVLAMHGGAETITSRKKEYSIELTRMLLERYNILFAEMQKAGWRIEFIDSGESPPEKVVDLVLSIISGHFRKKSK